MINHFIKNSSTLELIKWLSIITMVIDHVAYMFYDSNMLLRFIGRFALIGFSFLIAYHYRFNTHDKSIYKKRIFIFALLSQYPFNLLFPNEINILFLLWYGLIIIDQVHLVQKENKIFMPTVIISLGLIMSLFTGYFLFGLFLIPLFYFMYDRKIALYLLILDVLQLNFSLIYSAAGAMSLYIIYKLNITCKIPRMNKYIFYLFYPAHLLFLALIKISV
jgi:hypothetical protein